jgi:hypothetical protein
VAPAPVAFEGEGMTRSSSSSTAIRTTIDLAASSFQTLQFRTGATYATKSYTTTRAADQIVLRMRGDQCSGAPQATVRIDSYPARTVSVPATGYTDYPLALTAANGGAAGAHTLRVTYPADAKTSRCDRSLYLDKVTIRQV